MVLRYPQEGMQDLQTIGRTLIDSPSQAKVPLEAIAEVYEDRSPNFISR
jgi:Cu/Ag efflux pump CusA